MPDLHQNLYETLFQSAENGNTQTVMDTIQELYHANAGSIANILSTRDFLGRTPLHLAAEKGHTDLIIQYLELLYQAETTPFIIVHQVINLFTFYGETALHLAAKHGHSETLLVLIDALQKNNHNPIEELLDIRSQLDLNLIRLALQNSNNGDMLITLFSLVSPEVICNLINKPNQYGSTPLIATLKHPHPAFLENVFLLISYGAEIPEEYRMNDMIRSAQNVFKQLQALIYERNPSDESNKIYHALPEWAKNYFEKLEQQSKHEAEALCFHTFSTDNIDDYLVFFTQKLNNMPCLIQYYFAHYYSFQNNILEYAIYAHHEESIENLIQVLKSIPYNFDLNLYEFLIHQPNQNNLTPAAISIIHLGIIENHTSQRLETRLSQLISADTDMMPLHQQVFSVGAWNQSHWLDAEHLEPIRDFLEPADSFDSPKQVKRFSL